MYKLDRWQLKKFILSTDVYQKSLETEFSIAICRQSGDKWQPKTLFLTNFDLRSSINKSIFDCRLSGCDVGNIIRKVREKIENHQSCN